MSQTTEGGNMIDTVKDLQNSVARYSPFRTVRFYDEQTGVEYIATSVFMEDGIVCIDLAKQDGLTEAQA